jgi:hypothetical protein
MRKFHDNRCCEIRTLHKGINEIFFPQFSSFLSTFELKKLIQEMSAQVYRVVVSCLKMSALKAMLPSFIVQFA